MIAKLCALGVLSGVVCGDLTPKQYEAVQWQGLTACQAGVNPSVIYSEKHSEQWREAWLHGYSSQWCDNGWNKTK
jgi:hypothetical protein